MDEMQLNISGNKIEVNGIIKTINDAQEIIDALKGVRDNTVYLKINDSFGLPSSIIGYLMQLKDEGKEVFLEVKSDILYSLLEDLDLVDVFNVRKV